MSEDVRPCPFCNTLIEEDEDGQEYHADEGGHSSSRHYPELCRKYLKERAQRSFQLIVNLMNNGSPVAALAEAVRMSLVLK